MTPPIETTIQDWILPMVKSVHSHFQRAWQDGIAIIQGDIFFYCIAKNVSRSKY
jgi:hypothetical protein